MKLFDSNFISEEFQCPHCGEVVIDARLVMALQEVRERVGTAVRVNSGYRCQKHNAAIGGALNSQHLQGIAADFQVKGKTVQELLGVVEDIPWVNGIGVMEGALHVDVRRGPRVYWVYPERGKTKTVTRRELHQLLGMETS